MTSWILLIEDDRCPAPGEPIAFDYAVPERLGAELGDSAYFLRAQDLLLCGQGLVAWVSEEARYVIGDDEEAATNPDLYIRARLSCVCQESFEPPIEVPSRWRDDLPRTYRDGYENEYGGICEVSAGLAAALRDALRTRAAPDPGREKGLTTMRDEKQERAIQWLRDEKRHQESILYSRVNIFILVVSLLVAALIGIADSPLRLLTACLGLAVTTAWFAAVQRQQQIVNDLRAGLLAVDSNYQDMKDQRKVLDQKRRFVSGQRLLFIYLPLAFGLFWLLAAIVLGTRLID